MESSDEEIPESTLKAAAVANLEIFITSHISRKSNEPLWLKRGKKEILTKERQDKKPNPERVKALAKQIDGYFISKWYINISKDASFPGECRVFLEETITRLAEVQLGVNNKVLLHACLNIFLRHSKEFRRGLKRKEKYGGTIEELYRYSHLCSNNTKAKICFIHGLTTNLMRHFINSELWGSLPSQILVSVIARKLVTFLSKLLSDPEVLNYILLNSLASETVKEKYKLSEYSHINISQYYDVTDSKDATSEMKMGKSVVDSGHTKSVNQVDALKENNGNHKTIGLDSKCIPVTAASSPRNINSIYRKSHTSRKNKGQKIDCAEELREEPLQKSSRSNPVKIHEPTARKSLKTYSDSKDLALGVSLGQDPLEAWLEPTENVKQGGKTSFWDPGKIEQYVEEAPAHANLLLNEVKLTTQNTMEGLKSSMKPISDATVHTLHNIKDLQESTVNNALHKIGDFQDEAAGMVGGILDFGRARLRKGLRLSGLQDNIENAKASLNLSSQSNKYQSKFRANKSTKHESPVQVSSEEATDSVWFNPLQMESPSFDGHILLCVKKIGLVVHLKYISLSHGNMLGNMRNIPLMYIILGAYVTSLGGTVGFLYS
ncbi:hypothetical protein JTB14_020117 [Gonioctena quinquepunctata]|nr:hypothetical protein JTB14_020117 [Gonioctena quinquepunctata]